MRFSMLHDVAHDRYCPTGVLRVGEFRDRPQIGILSRGYRGATAGALPFLKESEPSRFAPLASASSLLGPGTVRVVLRAPARHAAATCSGREDRRARLRLSWSAERRRLP